MNFGIRQKIKSQLIELLSDDELSFVVGHEFGHFLLGHSCIKNIEENQKNSDKFK